jgi:hypothetical protein
MVHRDVRISSDVYAADGGLGQCSRRDARGEWGVSERSPTIPACLVIGG